MIWTLYLLFIHFIYLFIYPLLIPGFFNDAFDSLIQEYILWSVNYKL
jgi:hypothetical protein